MTAPVLGIDLGTTNSVVAVADGSPTQVLADADGYRLVPSVVGFHPGGEIIVGRAARERRLLDARNTVYSVKRLIGRPFKSEEVRRARERFAFELQEGLTGGVLVAARGETYTLSEISAFVLREVRKLAENALGKPCEKAVITVPANFNELQRSATKAAGRIAGLEVLRILNEPTAAALAHGYGRGSRERIAVYDLGGGTFDLTILDLAGEVFEVMATAGDTFLGGDDIDVLIAEQMAEAFLEHHRYDPRSDRQAYERLRAAAEWAKCQLSFQPEIQVRVEELAYGEGGAPLDLTFGLTRAALERMIQPLIGRTFDVCEDAMRVAGIRPTQLDNVILVGGSTRTPLVMRMVRDYFGREPLADIDPELVVAQGAAIQGFALSAPARRQLRPTPQPVGRLQLKRITQTDLKAQKPPKGGVVEAPTKVIEEVAPMTRWSSVPPPPPPPPSAGMPPRAPTAPPPAAREAAARMAPVAPSFGGDDDQTVPDMTDLAMETAESLPVPEFAPPLLLDVTPMSLGIETVGGYCEHVIKRNATIPVEQSRIFTTGQDNQQLVRVQICQGESRRLEENQPLGAIELTGLRMASRGAVKIGVTFVIDADGTLGVRAQDLATGAEQSIRINLLGGLPDEEIQQMRQRQARLLKLGPP